MSIQKKRFFVAITMFSALVFLTTRISTVSASPPCDGENGTVKITSDDDDTFVRESFPSQNYDSETYMIVGRSFGRMVSLMHFAEVGMPVGACVETAELHVFVDSTEGNVPQKVVACRIDSPWDGNTVNWTSRPAMTQVCSESILMEPGQNTFEVISIVQDWANGASNDGIALRPLGAPSYRYFINTSEKGSYVPELYISYQNP